MNIGGDLIKSKSAIGSETLELIDEGITNGYRTVATNTAAPTFSISRAMDFVTLSKPEITFMVMLACAVGGVMASTSPDTWNLLHALFGTAFVASGAAALNQYLEREDDGKMRRTASRPLPARRLTPRQALYFGAGLSVTGTLYLAYAVNILTSLIGVAALLSYLFLYTPLKHRTRLCTLIGAFPGAAPILMGWSAMQGSLSPHAWLLYSILFLWQFPHFLAIAWLYREDYAEAGMLMLPNGDNEGGNTFRRIWIVSLLLIVATLMPCFVGMTGKVYPCFALFLAAGLLFFVYRLSSRRSKNAARQLLHATVVYLPLLYLLMVLDKSGLPRG